MVLLSTLRRVHVPAHKALPHILVIFPRSAHMMSRHTVHIHANLHSQVQLTDMPTLRDCCNDHDECYSLCGGNKNECDLKLQRCARDTCLDAGRKDALNKNLPAEVITGF